MCRKDGSQTLENYLKLISNMTLPELVEALKITSEEIELRVMQVAEDAG